MVIEISIAIICLTLVVLAIFTIHFLLTSVKTLKATKRDFHHLTNETVTLIHKLNTLTTDLKSKSESLNFVFDPLKALSHKEKKSEHGTVNEIVEWVTKSLVLVNKLRTYIHEKK